MSTTRETATEDDAELLDGDIDVEQRDGKTLVSIDDLENWEENPREADEGDIERLRTQIETLGLYKPLIVTSAGVVAGGNMRLKALRAMADDPEAETHDEVWVSVIEPEDEDELLEYALSDNDRAGSYVEEDMTDLLGKYEVDVTDFKVDFYAPQDLVQNVASGVDPQSLIDNATEDDAEADAEGDSEDGPVDEEGGNKSATPRSLENLGNETSTTMLQLVMTQADKDTLSDQIGALKEQYGLSTSSDVVQEAVEFAYQQQVETPDKSSEEPH